MSQLRNSTDALKHLRSVLEALAGLTELYRDSEPEVDDEAEHESEQDIVNRIVEEGVELGMDEEGLEKLVKSMLSYAQKSAE